MKTFLSFVTGVFVGAVGYAAATIAMPNLCDAVEVLSWKLTRSYLGETESKKILGSCFLNKLLDAKISRTIMKRR